MSKNPKKSRTLDIVALAVAMSTLLAGTIWRLNVPSDEDMSRYHSALELVAHGFPPHIEGWRARNVELPRAAMSLLKPTISLSRQYVREADGINCTFLLIHCRDARDLLGHYPPNCYPGSGWSVDKTSDITVNTPDGSAVNGRLYQFKRPWMDGGSSLLVYHFFYTPDGATSPDMKTVQRVVGDRMMRPRGAAQVQVVMDEMTSPETRRQLIESMIQIHRPLMDAIASKSGPGAMGETWISTAGTDAQSVTIAK
jgi:hypothetical protein